MFLQQTAEALTGLYLLAEIECEDEALVQKALQMALLRRHPAPGLLYHSDRGAQYTSSGYQATLAQAGMIVSMSRTDNCYENAPMESLINILSKNSGYLMPQV